MHKIVRIAGLLVLLALPTFSLRAEGSIGEEFAQANEFYEQKDYSSAIRLYESILSEGTESAGLYYNLGNAYFKSGNLGQAIANYMRARRLDPGDPDIRHNLEFAHRLPQIQMEGVELNPIRSTLAEFVEPYRLNTLAWISSVLFILLTAALTLRYGLERNNLVVRSGIIVSLMLLLVMVSLTTFKYRHEYLTRRAVIVADESPVYTGASNQSDIELHATPGLVVEIVEESDEFYNVLFENKRRGWILKDLVAVI